MIKVRPGSANDPERERVFTDMQVACAGRSGGAVIAAHIDSLACCIGVLATDPANAQQIIDSAIGDLRRAVRDNWQTIKDQLVSTGQAGRA